MKYIVKLYYILYTIKYQNVDNNMSLTIITVETISVY